MESNLIIIITVMLVHLCICPFTKVEESFNLQAMHDLLYISTNFSQYDHLEFPGVVPRTFLGPLIVSAISAPLTHLTGFYELNKFVSQLIVRGVLGILVALAFHRFQKSISNRLGKGTGRWLTLLTVSQFHFMFYMSRPLPNVFALVTVLLSLHFWLDQRYGWFIWLSGFSIVVFRAELVLFLGLIVLMELFSRRLGILYFILHTMLAGIVCIDLTVAVDSFFWERWLWPEGEVFYYNTILNKSANWGTSPFLWYFYSAIPRSMSAGLCLVPLGLFIDRRTVQLIIPATVFVLLFSLLPHKELRFVIYIIPVFNAVAAVAADRMWKNRRKNFLRGIMALGVVGLLLLNMLTTVGFTYISHNNYPGGQAMHKLHQLLPSQTDVHVHIDVPSAQTGISRFTQLHDHWIYNKTEHLTPAGADMMSYSHLLIGVSSEDMMEIEPYAKSHNVLHSVYAFSGISYERNQVPPFLIKTEPKIILLEKKTENEDNLI